jgi:virulence factor Mce-like protein
MNAIVDRISARTLAVATVLILLVGTFLVFHGGTETRTVRAHFSRAVSIYPGSDVRVMGVKIGTVTAVVPEGDTIRVDMEYDADYKVPADAKAAIVTPTLVADRYVQLTPAYTKGAVMQTGADIKLPDTGNPVELDRIYQSLATLTEALGPNGVNKDGTLDKVLGAGAKALKGRGELANQTIINLAAATHTFGDNADPLFASVRQLAQFSNTLAENDQVVSSFMLDLSGVSQQLSGERVEISGALKQLARALSTVRTFVHDNKAALKTDIENLTGVVGALAKEKDALALELEKGALGAGNLAIAYDVPSGTIGSRVQIGPLASDLDGFLCGVISNSAVSNPKQVCKLLKGIVDPLNLGLPNLGAGTRQSPGLGSKAPQASFDGLLGGGR